MKVFIGLVLLCVTCLPAFGDDDHSQYCEECLGKSVVSGYYPHLQRCDAYVQCEVQNNTYAGYERFCGEGTCFNKESLVCEHCSDDICQIKCDQPKKFKDIFSCYKYFTCDQFGFNTIPHQCASHQRFDEDTSSCVLDINCQAPTPIECFKYFKLSATLGKYWQKTADSWIERACSSGTAFDMVKCTCSEVIPVMTPIDSTCLLIDLPLKTDSKDVTINHWYVQSIGDVTFHSSAAHFTDSSALVAPVFTNNDFGDRSAIKMNVRIESTPEDSFFIVSNGNCDRQPTIAIKVENAKSSPKIVGFLKLEGMVYPVEIKALVSLNKWFSIKFGKSSDSVRMYLDGILVDEKTIEGSIETVDSALSIGRPCTSNSFIGSITAFKFSKCPGW